MTEETNNHKNKSRKSSINKSKKKKGIFFILFLCLIKSMGWISSTTAAMMNIKRKKRDKMKFQGK